jgi:hypothetical protein
MPSCQRGGSAPILARSDGPATVRVPAARSGPMPISAARGDSRPGRASGARRQIDRRRAARPRPLLDERGQSNLARCTAARWERRSQVPGIVPHRRLKTPARLRPRPGPQSPLARVLSDWQTAGLICGYTILPVGCANAFMQLVGTRGADRREAMSMHPAWVTFAGDRQGRGGVGRLKVQRPVRAMPVVVLDVEPQHLLEMAAPDDQQPVQALGTDGANPAFRVGVGVGGACTGVNSTWAPTERNTSSKARQNLASWSRSKKPTCRPRSSSASRRLRACWATQRRWGWWSRRPGGRGGCPVRCRNSTYSRRSQTVSTVKKSQATIPAACWRRNARQVVLARRGAGSSRWWRSVVRIAVAEACTPRRSSSPWMR